MSPISFEGSGTGKHGRKKNLKTIKTCPKKQLGYVSEVQILAEIGTKTIPIGPLLV